MRLSPRAILVAFVIVAAGGAVGVVSAHASSTSVQHCEQDACFWGVFCDRSIFLTGCNVGATGCDTYECPVS